jgi:hypothetical protein
MVAHFGMYSGRRRVNWIDASTLTGIRYVRWCPFSLLFFDPLSVHADFICGHSNNKKFIQGGIGPPLKLSTQTGWIKSETSSGSRVGV